MTAGGCEPWADATFDGAERRLRRAVAAATAQRRMDWLEEALELALASGALADDRRLRQERCEHAWNRVREES